MRKMELVTSARACGWCSVVRRKWQPSGRARAAARVVGVVVAAGGAICLAESGSCVSKARAGATSSRGLCWQDASFINSLCRRQAWLGLRELKRDGTHIPLRGCLIEVKMKHEQLSSSFHPTFTDIFTASYRPCASYLWTCLLSEAFELSTFLGADDNKAPRLLPPLIS